MRPNDLKILMKPAHLGKQCKIRPATQCPICNSPVTHTEGEVFYYCSNLACPGRVAREIEYFVGRGQMDIEGLGEKGVRQLLTAGLIKDQADLFALKAEDLANLDGYADLKIQNLLTNLAAAKTRPPDK